MGLTISASKSEIMLKTLMLADTDKNRILCGTSDDMFQIFGNIFRCWVAIELPCEICTAKMLPKSNLVEIGGRCFLGSAFILYDTVVKGIWLGLFYTNMAKTHMLGLERVQNRALRIALGLMGSTPNNCLDFLSGIPPLAESFAYLNFRYLVAAFYRLGQPLREGLEVMWALNMGRCIRGYFVVLALDIVPSESFTRHELRNLPMFRRRCNRELLTVTSGNSASCIF
jgi:hypothetical protein